MTILQPKREKILFFWMTLRNYITMDSSEQDSTAPLSNNEKRGNLRASLKHHQKQDEQNYNKTDVGDG